MYLGRIIKQARKDKGLTLKELGEKIGLAHSTLSSIENNKRKPSRSTLIALAKELRDNFGEEWLDEHIGPDEAIQKELEQYSVEDLVSLKFGGGREERTDEELLELARMLDKMGERRKKMMSLPVRKSPSEKASDEDEKEDSED